MLYLDTKIFMTSLNLTYNDKMSMASSVEVRVPFLDRELAEFVAWNVPPNLKVEGFAAADDEIHLPPSDARHFAARSVAATESWLRRSGRLLVGARSQGNGGRSALAGADASRGLFQPAAVRRFIDEHRSGRHDWSMQLWQFLTLELWMQTFLDGGARKI